MLKLIMAVAIPVSEAIVEQDPVPILYTKLDISDDSSVSSAEEHTQAVTESLLPKITHVQKRRLCLTWGLLRTGCLVSFVLGAGGFFFYCLYLVIHFGVI
jgi:hypothetical protein